MLHVVYSTAYCSVCVVLVLSRAYGSNGAVQTEL
jgi:hypothetical protein